MIKLLIIIISLFFILSNCDRFKRLAGLKEQQEEIPQIDDLSTETKLANIDSVVSEIEKSVEKIGQRIENVELLVEVIEGRLKRVEAQANNNEKIYSKLLNLKKKVYIKKRHFKRKIYKKKKRVSSKKITNKYYYIQVGAYKSKSNAKKYQGLIQKNVGLKMKILLTKKTKKVNHHHKNEYYDGDIEVFLKNKYFKHNDNINLLYKVVSFNKYSSAKAKKIAYALIKKGYPACIITI